jgi:probable F420-dependent oxidoreductase
MLSALAGVTRTIKLGTMVLVLPLRNPVYFAKEWATLDLLSGGRTILGVGVGWHEEEFGLMGIPHKERGRRMDEMLELVTALWAGDNVTYAGKYYQVKNLTIDPKPVQKPHPPIWIGGHSPAALRRVARLGDGWHPVGANPAVPLRAPELSAALAELRRLTEAEGRDPSRLTISYKAPVYDPAQPLDERTGERRPFSGSPGEVENDIATFAGLGVSEIIFDFRSERLDESLERMERFAPMIRVTARV